MTSRPVPKNFYDLELKNPKRATGFSFIGKSLLATTKKKNIGKLQLEEKLIEENEKDMEDQLKVYQSLLGNMGMKVGDNLVNKHAIVGIDRTMIHDQDNDISRRQPPRNQMNQSQNYQPVQQYQQFQQNNSQPLQQQNNHVHFDQQVRNNEQNGAQSPELIRDVSPEHSAKILDNSVVTEAREYNQAGFNSGVTVNHNHNPNFYESMKDGGKGLDQAQAQENFQQVLDSFVYDRFDNDLNRRANKAHNLRDHIRFAGAGVPGNNPEYERLQDVQKKLTYASMLQDQIKSRNKREELRKLKEKEQDLKDLERIRKENEQLEYRKLQEDQLIKNREQRMREFNGIKAAMPPTKQKNNKINSSISNFGSPTLKKNISHITIEESINESNSDDGMGGVEVRSSPYRRVHLSQVKNQIVKDEISKDVDIARDQMTHYKNSVKRDLQYELRKEREFLETLPDQVRAKIQGQMDIELRRLKNEVNQGTNILRDEILRLRSQAVALDEEKRKANEDLHRLRKQLAEIQYKDDIRTTELMEALAEDNLYRLLPSSTKYTMPEALFTDNDQNRFPISMYDKDRVIKGESKLYTDGYFRDLSDLTSDLNTGSKTSRQRCRCGGYHSSRIDCLGGSNRLAESTPNLYGNNAYFHDSAAEKIYSKNYERDNVYGSILDKKNTWTVDEYLKEDLENPLNLSF